MVTVLVAVDETPESVEALATAHQLFGDGARYLAVNVASRPVGWTSGYGWGSVWPAVYTGPGAMLPVAVTSDVADPALDEERARREREAEATADEALREAGIAEGEAIGELGDPVQAVLDAAEGHHADVIVVGSRSRGWWRRLFEGSVSEEILRGADRPVLVVR